MTSDELVARLGGHLAAGGLDLLAVASVRAWDEAGHWMRLNMRAAISCCVRFPVARIRWISRTARGSLTALSPAIAWSRKADVHFSLGGGSSDDLQSLLSRLRKLPAVLSTDHIMPPV